MLEQRHQMRQYFIDTWQKREKTEQLSALEHQLLEVIEAHPEYQKYLENPDLQDKDYQTDTNPFLHMSLHLGLIEQLSTNRPANIRNIYQRCLKKYGDEHHVQHLLMNIIAETLWEAQQNQSMPDENAYMQKLEKLKINT